MKEIRAAGYCGIGTRAELNKNESMSIDRQKRSILSFKDENGYSFTSFYLEMKKPGKNDEDREQIRLLLKDAHDGKFDVLIVKRLDRLSRDIFFQLWVEKELLKSGVKVIPVEQSKSGVREDIDVFCRKLVEEFAGFEKEKSVKELTPVKKTKSAQPPQMATDQSIYGWRKIGMNGQFQMVPHQEEQIHLKTMRKLRDMGWSDGQIAELFTEGGFIADTWYDRVKPRESAKWDSNMVRTAIEHDPSRV